MKLSIVIPAYNEEKRISPTLEQILSYLKKQNYDSEIIIVNDGSKDKTEEIIKKFAEENNSQKINILPLSYSPNKGKGYAVRTGMLAAKGDNMYLCDADLSTPIEEIDKFLKYSKDYDIVVGSRALQGADVNTSIVRKVMGRLSNLLISTTVKGIKDTQAGFKLFNNNSKKLFELQTIERWGYDFEILHLAQRLGFKIKEIPVKWINAEGSKVKPTDYFKTLGELLKINFTKYKLDGNHKKD